MGQSEGRARNTTKSRGAGDTCETERGAGCECPEGNARDMPVGWLWLRTPLRGMLNLSVRMLGWMAVTSRHAWSCSHRGGEMPSSANKYIPSGRCLNQIRTSGVGPGARRGERLWEVPVLWDLAQLRLCKARV